MRKNITQPFILSVTIGLIAGCSTNNTPPSSSTTSIQSPSGFLPNYNLLKPVASPEGTKIYVYKNPNALRSNYHAAIVEPVLLYQTASDNGVAKAKIQQAQADINQGIQKIVSRRLPLTTTPGPGVLRLQVAITGARVEADGFKPWNVIPVSAALKLASMATGTDSKKPILVIEIKAVDSQTGSLLKAVLTQISGEEFRNQSNTAAEFSTLATSWVQQALRYSN